MIRADIFMVFFNFSVCRSDNGTSPMSKAWDKKDRPCVPKRPSLCPLAGGRRGVDGFRMGCQTVAGVSVTMHTVSSSPSGIRLKRT